MKIPHPRFLHLAAGAAALSVVTAVLVAMTGHGAWSQTTKTIKLIVPSPPGGSSDVLARLLAEEISRAKGPTIVIENRPGAGTMIGTEAAARGRFRFLTLRDANGTDRLCRRDRR